MERTPDEAVDQAPHDADALEAAPHRLLQAPASEIAAVAGTERGGTAARVFGTVRAFRRTTL